MRGFILSLVLQGTLEGTDRHSQEHAACSYHRYHSLNHYDIPMFDNDHIFSVTKLYVNPEEGVTMEHMWFF